MDLTGRSAIITGANQGLGKAIAAAFVRAGAGVLLTARSEDLLRDVRDELKALARPGRPVEVLRADVSKPDDCAATVRRARHEPHGRLLLARFFYVDAIATVLAFMTVYARRTGDFDGREIDLLLAISAVTAIAGAQAKAHGQAVGFLRWCQPLGARPAR